VLGSIAEFERNTTIDNVKLGMAQVARSGKWTGGIVLGYDTLNKQLVVKEEEAKIVKMIFDMYVDGKGCVQIRDKLNQLNLKTKKGLTFTQQAVITILANPVYKGFIRYGRTTNYDHKGKRKKEDQFILEKGIHEPIIDEDTFEKAQIITEQNRRQTRRMPSNPHMLSGLLRCPECGGRMNYQPAGQRKHNDKHGGYYNCSTYKNTRECNHNTLRAKQIEKEVIARIKHVVNNKQILDNIVSEINSNNKIDTGLIHKQLQETDKQISKYTTRLAEIKQEFLDEKITYEDYKDFKAIIEHNLKELNAKKQEMEIELVKALNTSYDANEVRFVLEHFDTLMDNADVQLKKQLLESLIEHINLNPDKTLKSIEFKFEVPNQHASENNDKNVILTYDTVHRNGSNGEILGHPAIRVP
jgi:site-specific DNA recombinase